VKPSGPPITSEEDADTKRRELDALADNDPSRPGRRQALLDYYVATAGAALEHNEADDAYGSFESALALFEAYELQDPSRPPSAEGLLTLARRLDRLFSRRGAHPPVVTAMMVEMTLQPGDPELRRRFGELRDWLNSQSDGMRNLVRGRTGSLSDLLAAPPPTLLSDLEQTYRIWPAVVVRDELISIHRAEAASLLSGGKKSPKDFLQSLSASLRRKGLTNGPAFKIGRVYLRASRPQEAVAAIKQLGRLSAEDAKLLELLEDTVGRPPGPGDEGDKLLPAVKLAMGLAQNPEDAEVSLQLCRDVAQRAPKLVNAQMCVGELSLALDRKGLALRSFERARALTPSDRGVWDVLGRLYVDRLSDLVSDERVADLEGGLAQVEGFYQSMRKQFPERSPMTGIAVALAEVGRGYYNAGRIPDAVRYLDRSIATEPNAVALEQLGVLQMRRGQNDLAVATLERARTLFMANQQAEPAVRMMFYARMGRLIADALGALPQAEARGQASEARERTLRQFEQLIDSNKLPGSRVAEAEVERGKLLYESGQRQEALEAFRRATDLASGDEQVKAQGQIYVDALAYLVPRGELEEALGTYHRALGKVHLPENMKVYISLWVSDLLARAGQPPDPLADGVLSSVEEGRWPADLARWASGRLSEKELLARADTPGKQAEINFYLGMARLRAGDHNQAEERWRKVLDTQMLGYFEYEMAGLYLRQKGAPTTPTIPATPPAPRRDSQPVPAGSI
jgi:tetratricopeptide (TPR) repeat protein